MCKYNICEQCQLLSFHGYKCLICREIRNELEGQSIKSRMSIQFVEYFDSGLTEIKINGKTVKAIMRKLKQKIISINE